MAVGQNEWYHFGVGAPPILELILVGDWDVHWGYGILTHGHINFEGSTFGGKQLWKSAWTALSANLEGAKAEAPFHFETSPVLALPSGIHCF